MGGTAGRHGGILLFLGSNVAPSVSVCAALPACETAPAVLPSVLLLCSGKPLKPWYRALNWFLVVFFSLSTLMAGVTSLRDIVVSVGSNTQMFQ